MNNGYVFCILKVCATKFGDVCHAVGQEATEKILVCEIFSALMADSLLSALSESASFICNSSAVLHSSVSDFSTGSLFPKHEAALVRKEAEAARLAPPCLPGPLFLLTVPAALSLCPSALLILVHGHLALGPQRL